MEAIRDDFRWGAWEEDGADLFFLLEELVTADGTFMLEELGTGAEGTFMIEELETGEMVDGRVDLLGMMLAEDLLGMLGETGGEREG